MFIYFPEYLYKKIKNYTFNTFNSGVSEKEAKNLIQEKLSDPEYSCLVSSFKKDKISLPIIKLKVCNNLLKNEVEQNLGLISSYNRIENKIEICNDYIESASHFESLIDKELTYAYEFSTRKGKLSLNDLATMSINACRSSLKNDTKNLHNMIQSEIVKRCAYLEYKYKFSREIKNYYEEEYPEMDNIKLNEIVRKIIDINFK
jgi:uncharacterized protein YfkK (UPF0435 family)